MRCVLLLAVVAAIFVFSAASPVESENNSENIPEQNGQGNFN